MPLIHTDIQQEKAEENARENMHEHLIRTDPEYYLENSALATIAFNAMDAFVKEAEEYNVSKELCLTWIKEGL